MLVKSQHLESKGKKIKSSRSPLAIQGVQDQPGLPCFKTRSNPSNNETLQELKSRTLGTLTDRSGSTGLACRGRQGCGLAFT